MRRLPLVAFPLLAAVAAASCGDNDYGDDDDGGTASIAVEIGCAGDGCGHTGSLKLPVHETSCAAPVLITISISAVTTDSAEDVTRSIDGLEAGQTYCIETYLDVDGDGSRSSGDVVTSAPGQVAAAGDDSVLSFVLDGVEP